MLKFVGTLAALCVIVALGLVIDIRSDPTSHAESSHGRFFLIAAPGYVEGIAPEAELRPEQSGRVVEILVEEGQQVAAGQVLLRLDDELARYEVDLAASELEIARGALDRLMNGARLEEIEEAAARVLAVEAKLSLAKDNWERARSLFERKAISRQEADKFLSDAEVRSAEFAIAKAQLKLIKAPPRADELHMAEARVGAAHARQKQAVSKLQRTRLRAPISGKVLQIYPELGEMVGPDSLEPAVVMADTSRLFVRAYVEELDAPRVRIGMTATITADGLPDEQLTGRVTRLSPRMDRKTLRTNHSTERIDTKVREVWIELDATPHTQALVVGLRVDVLIDPSQPLVEKPQGEAPARKSAALTPGGVRTQRITKQSAFPFAQPNSTSVLPTHPVGILKTNPDPLAVSGSNKAASRSRP